MAGADVVAAPVADHLAGVAAKQQGDLSALQLDIEPGFHILAIERGGQEDLASGRDIISLGKIGDIFAHRGTGRIIKAAGNRALFTETLQAAGALDDLSPHALEDALRAAGGTFIAGADIEEFLQVRSSDDAEKLSLDGQSLLDRLEQLRTPIVAAIHGACMGGGLETAMACAWRIGTDHPKTVLALPEEEAPGLRLAYACSVHRGQGIELPVAVALGADPITDRHGGHGRAPRDHASSHRT